MPRRCLADKPWATAAVLIDLCKSRLFCQNRHQEWSRSSRKGTAAIPVAAPPQSITLCAKSSSVSSFHLHTVAGRKACSDRLPWPVCTVVQSSARKKASGGDTKHGTLKAGQEADTAPTRSAAKETGKVLKTCVTSEPLALFLQSIYTKFASLAT